MNTTKKYFLGVMRRILKLPIYLLVGVFGMLLYLSIFLVYCASMATVVTPILYWIFSGKSYTKMWDDYVFDKI